MGRRILIVDDEPYILRILSFKLRREGFLTAEAESAPEALSILENQPVDLILLDVALATSVNGFDLAAQLRADPKTESIPIIMLTARSFASDVKRGHEVGAAGYITKPFSTADVIDRVVSLLG
jgi:DNA-binding response OmpR family regulator